MESQTLVTGLGFVLTVALGIWLSRVGKPYNGLLFNIHKLVALGTVIVALVTLYSFSASVSMTALPLGALVLTGLLVVILFVSGALLSLGKLDYALTKMVHIVALPLVTIAAGTVIYLLTKPLAGM